MIIFRTGSASHVGRVRSVNQDFHYESMELCIVADGMGGAAALLSETQGAGAGCEGTCEGQWRHGGSFWQLTQIGLVAGVLCAINFGLGWKFGGRGIPREVSQSLGQKNTLLSIWIAMTYVNPMVALGPTFYILCHNTYNAWQLARYRPEAFAEEEEGDLLG